MDHQPTSEGHLHQEAVPLDSSQARSLLYENDPKDRAFSYARKEAMDPTSSPNDAPESSNLLAGSPVPPRGNAPIYPKDEAMPPHPPTNRASRENTQGPKPSTNTWTILLVLIGLSILLALAWRYVAPTDPEVEEVAPQEPFGQNS